MARLTDVFRGGDAAYKGLKHRRVPIFVDDNISMVMDMDSDYLLCDENHHPSKTEMDQFLKKFRLLEKPELETALRVTNQEFLEVLNQLVPCVGCRRRAEALYQQVTECGISAFYPLCVDQSGAMNLAKDRIHRTFLCSLFHCPSVKMQTLLESLSKCKSGRRCTLHSMESQRIRTVSSWVDVWDYMDEKCQERVVLVDAKSLMETLERYLRKHRFCTECKSKVLRAYNILIGEVDPNGEIGYIPQLYDGIECCKEDRHLHVLCKTEFVSRLIAKAVPELVGTSRRERHAKTMEIAQEEVLTCLGLCVFERLHRIQNRFREEERTWEIIMCVAIQAFRRSFEMAVEKKLGVSQLELLCEELSKEEHAKQQRKELKKQKRKRKKEKKAEETVPEEDEDAPETESCATPVAMVEEEEEEEIEEKENCSCEPVDVGNGGKKKKKKSGKGKGKNVEQECSTANSSPLGPVNSGVNSSSNVSNLVSNHSSRCSGETTDCGYSSGNNIDNASCSSPEGSEIACTDTCCNHSAFRDYSNSRMESDGDKGKLVCNIRVHHSYPIPYRSLEEQLESSCESEDDDFIPEEEVSAILTPVWEGMREKLREKLRLEFDKMMTGTNKVFGVTCKCDEDSCATTTSAEDAKECATKDSNKKDHMPRSGGMNKGRQSQSSKKYKGKNRR